MGAPIAHNLLAAGFEVSVWDRSAERAAALAADGARLAASAAEDAEGAQTGTRRYRPGPGRGLHSPGMPLPPPATHDEGRLTSEIDSLVRALEQHGATDRDELARLVGARYWGPGRFAAALRAAVAEGRVRGLTRSRFEARSTNPTQEDPHEPAPV
jgi:hypothetical protein